QCTRTAAIYALSLHDALPISGFIEKTRGTVTVGGTEVTAPGPDRGVVFQSHALFPWKTVLGNVTFGLRMKGMDKARREQAGRDRSEEHTSELQSRENLVCRLL